MSSYVGRHAQLYDLFYADKPYKEESYFVHSCLQKYGKAQRLLELACGTGEHALALEELGYEIVAADYSKDMLECAQNKANKVSSKIKFYLQDNRTLDLPVSPFDAVLCLFDSIGYVRTNEALIQVLNGVKQHLCPEGLFIFEFWHAAAMLQGYEPVRIRRWKTAQGEILRISETKLNCLQQLAEVTYSVYELKEDNTYSSFVETQINRYFLVQEMSLLLSSCGFTILKWFAGFMESEEITEQTWHIVCVAQRDAI